MASLPFMEETTWHATLHSMAWWFDSIGDGHKIDGKFHTTHTSWIATNGTKVPHPGPDVPAPDGCLCDAAVPCGPLKNCCAYKQGDGNVPRHDWTFEETLSGLVMMGEQLLVARNKTGVKHYMPLFLRTSEMLEQRRDPVTSTFFTGVGSNLLAPSFGGGPNGTMAMMTGIVVTYTAALDRMIECAKLVEDGSTEAELQSRRAKNLAGLNSLLAPSKEYFVRSKDADGTLHGVLGQRPHGYFEASPNHDAVALRIADDELSETIMATIDKLGPLIRPNVFILPNSDATGLPAAPGSGAVGYDDMLCGNGTSCGSIFQFGTWVNGGVWTTTEARAILAYYRTGRPDAAAASMKQMKNLYASQWKLDNPLTKFGLDTYQKHPTMLTIDAFGAPAAGIRGLFEYLYSAAELQLVPHLSDNITLLTQHFGIRWGPYRFLISCSGIRSSGIGSVELGGKPLGAPHHFNSTTLNLQWAGLPPLSMAAAAAIDSDVRTAVDNVSLHITFKKTQRHIDVLTTRDAVHVDSFTAAAFDCSAWNCTCEGMTVLYGTVAGSGFGCAPPEAQAWWDRVHCPVNVSTTHAPACASVPPLGCGSGDERTHTGCCPACTPAPLPTLNCSSYGLARMEEDQIRDFLAAATAKQLCDTVPYHMGVDALKYSAGYASRCQGLQSGTIAALKDVQGRDASLADMKNTASSLLIGLKNLLADYANHEDPTARALSELWPKQ